MTNHQAPTHDGIDSETITQRLADSMAKPLNTGPRQDIVITYSELDTYRQCPLKHYIGYKELWRKEAKPGGALSRGTAWHDMMEAHYRALSTYDPDDRAGYMASTALDAAATAVAPHTTPTPDDDQAAIEQKELLAWMYEGYVEHYGADPLVVPLAFEGAGRARLRHASGRASRFVLQFKLDMLAYVKTSDQAPWRLTLIDHKTAGQFANDTEEQFSDQFALYSAALRELGINVEGSAKWETKTKRNKGKQELATRFRRTPIHHGDVELTNILTDALSTARAAHSPTTPLYSAPNPQQCGWKCDYREAHILSRKGFDLATALSDYGMQQQTTKHQEYTEKEAHHG